MSEFAELTLNTVPPPAADIASETALDVGKVVLFEPINVVTLLAVFSGVKPKEACFPANPIRNVLTESPMSKILEGVHIALICGDPDKIRLCQVRAGVGDHEVV
jgi:hypothetical protein